MLSNKFEVSLERSGSYYRRENAFPPMRFLIWGEAASDRFGCVRHGNELPTIATFLLAVAALRKPGHRMCRLGGRMAASGAAVASGTLPDMLRRMDSSAKRELMADPQNEALYPNQESRESFGHYVECQPDPLPQPYLVAASASMCGELGLSAEEAKEDGDPNVETAEAGVSLLERSGTRNISWSATAAATAAAVSFRASEAVVTALLADAS